LHFSKKNKTSFLLLFPKILYICGIKNVVIMKEKKDFYKWLISKLWNNSNDYSFSYIQEEWKRESGGKVLDRRSFQRLLQGIGKEHGVVIKIKRGVREDHSFWPYTIVNRDEIEQDPWLKFNISAMLLNNSLERSAKIRSRVILEHIPDGLKWVPTILEAMQNNRRIRIVYQIDVDEAEEHDNLAPYVLKQFIQRWYILGKKITGQLVLFGLDSITDIEILKTKFRYNEQEAEKFFSDIEVDDVFEE